MRRRVAPGLLVLVVGAALGLAIAGRPDAADQPVRVGTAAATARTTTTTTPVIDEEPAPSSTTTAAPGEVRVRAYNSSSTAGAAGDVSLRLKQAGYTTLSAATGPKDAPAKTRILFKPGFEPQARAVAALLQIGSDQVKAYAAERLPGAADTDVLVLVGDDVV